MRYINNNKEAKESNLVAEDMECSSDSVVTRSVEEDIPPEELNPEPEVALPEVKLPVEIKLQYWSQPSHLQYSANGPNGPVVDIL